MLKVLVIGGVAGGMSAAAKLKRNMKDAVEIEAFEKGREVSYGACGIPYYVGGKIADASRLVERTPEQFAESGIAVRLRHEVVAVDLKGKTVTVRNLDSGTTFVRQYDKLIVGSGARTRNFPPFDVDRENLHAVRTVEDGIRIRRRLLDGNTRDVLVVGAGFLGLEMAEACARQGAKVTLVEAADRVMPILDPEFSERLTAELEKHGVTVKVDSRVTELVCDGDRITSAVVEGRKGPEPLRTDLAINCVGIAPNTEFIDVDKAPNGAIIVDERMETSVPGVYAAGDCSVMSSAVTGELLYAPLGTNANKQGRIIAEVISGKPAPLFKLIGSSAVKLFDIDAAKVGLSESDARRLGLEYKTNLITGNSYASYYSDEEVTIKLVYDAKRRVILGAQLIGQGTVAPRANYFAIAMSCGMKIDDFGFLDLCYSPPFNGVWDVSLIAANTAK